MAMFEHRGYTYNIWTEVRQWMCPDNTRIELYPLNLENNNDVWAVKLHHENGETTVQAYQTSTDAWQAAVELARTHGNVNPTNCLG